MDQRRLRLGDILDDYCPRERRVTNHAVVAMIEDDVKQTRCTTCDTEHPYKGARVPRRRKKETPATLYREVLAGMPDESPPALAVPDAGTIVNAPEPSLPVEAAEAAAEPAEPEPLAARNSADDLNVPAPESAVESNAGEADQADGPVHRPLIRATLPRPEGQKDVRPLPEFTVRQSAGRGNGHFRGAGAKMHGGSGNPRMMGRSGNGMTGNGNRAPGGGRFQGGRPGQHRNPGGRGGAQTGFRGGQPRHGGKKGRGG